MSGKFDMSDYVPVNERVEQFYRAHPEGSIQSEIVELTEGRVTVKAYAYRVPDDPRPGIGHSSLNIPGSTPYTKGSEIENAETSAWGRAIAALGFEVKRGISSAEEVRNKTADAKPAKAVRPPTPPTPEAIAALDAALAGIDADTDRMKSDMNVAGWDQLTPAQVEKLTARAVASAPATDREAAI